jgi:uncharacterized protein YbjT (DUF2867 family)
VRMYQNLIGESIARTLEETGATHVVNLSSVGADLPDNTGPIGGLHDFEERLNGIKGLNVVHLRAAYFMENLMGNIGLIKTSGINGSALRGDLKMPMIAANDIGDVAAKYLSAPDFKGKSVRYLLGERDLTPIEVTRTLGNAIGKPGLQYMQFGYDDAEKAMTGMGMSPATAQSYVEMSRAFNEGTISAENLRTPEATTGTSIEEFAKEFSKAYCFNNPECAASGF